MEKLTKKEIQEIKEGLKNIKEGKTEPIEQVAKELKITLE